MTNFVFLSPNFPDQYWLFCSELKKNGVRVLGIGDSPYESLPQQLKKSMDDYQYVESLWDYDKLYRAMGYFVWKYGRIDWIESNNECWLEQDARLRQDFNVTTGLKYDLVHEHKEKSGMKKYYAQGGIRTARQIKADAGEKAVLKFSKDAGWPLFAKPDVGVGSCGTYKLETPEALHDFYQNEPQAENYVIEEFVTGDICTYDAIVNSKGELLFESMGVFPPSIADIANNNLDMTYYVEKEMSENLRFWGRRTLEAFNVRSRFIHFEFFRLDKAHRGLGEIGDFVALEVNMRPGGGYHPDITNYAHSVSVYKIWADMVAFDQRTTPDLDQDYYCAYGGRRDNVQYNTSHQEILDRFKGSIVMTPRLSAALAPDLGDQGYIARFNTEEDMQAFFKAIKDRK